MAEGFGVAGGDACRSASSNCGKSHCERVRNVSELEVYFHRGLAAHIPRRGPSAGQKALPVCLHDVCEQHK